MIKLNTRSEGSFLRHSLFFVLFSILSSSGAAEAFPKNEEKYDDRGVFCPPPMLENSADSLNLITAITPMTGDLTAGQIPFSFRLKLQDGSTVFDKILSYLNLQTPLQTKITLDPTFFSKGVIESLNRFAMIASSLPLDQRIGAAKIVIGLHQKSTKGTHQLSDDAKAIYREIWKVVRNNAAVQAALRQTLHSERKADVPFDLDNRKARAEADITGYVEFISKAMKVIITELEQHYTIKLPPPASIPNAVQNLLASKQSLPEHLIAVEAFIITWFSINNELDPETHTHSVAASFWLNVTPVDRLERSRQLIKSGRSVDEVIAQFISDEYDL